MSTIDWRDVARRTIRTALQAFLAVCAPATILAWLTGAAQVDKTLLITAGFAAATAVGTLLWNVFLDPSPIPSLAPNSSVPTLAERRLARLLDPEDLLDDLSDAEVRAVEQRGRDHQMDVKAGIHQARMVYVDRQRGGEHSGG